MSAYNPPLTHNGSINTVYNPADYIATNSSSSGNYLPLTGGTLTGLGLTTNKLALSSENVALGSGSGVNLGSTCVSIGYNSNSSAGLSKMNIPFPFHPCLATLLPSFKASIACPKLNSVFMIFNLI